MVQRAEAPQPRIGTVLRAIAILVAWLLHLGVLAPFLLGSGIPPLLYGLTMVLFGAILLGFRDDRSSIQEINRNAIQASVVLLCVTIFVQGFVLTFIPAYNDYWRGILHMFTTTSPAVAGVANAVYLNTQLFFAALIIAPILEEALYRKILLPNLMRYVPLGTSILVQAALFCVVHRRLDLTTFFAGVLFAQVYLRTGKILCSVLLHFVFNLSAIAIADLSLAEWMIPFQGYFFLFGVAFFLFPRSLRGYPIRAISRSRQKIGE